MDCDPVDGRSRVVAQVVVRDTEGRSIMDSGQALTHGNVQAFAIPSGRIDEASERLAALGFEIVNKGPHTLSACGTGALFEQTFGLRQEPSSSALTDKVVIPTDLEDIVADIFIPAAPTLFP